MGFRLSKEGSKRFPLGAEIEGIYGKIDKLIYDAQEETWQATVIYYINEQAAERARLINYLRQTFLDYSKPNNNLPLGYEFILRPKKYSINEWALIIQTANSPLPASIFSFKYGVLTKIIGPIELKKANVVGKIYKDFMEQCEPGSESILEDRPMEGINGVLTELLLTVKKDKPVKEETNITTNITNG
jgi:hypothetical protein